MAVCGFRVACRRRWKRGVVGRRRGRGWGLSVTVGVDLEIQCHTRRDGECDTDRYASTTAAGGRVPPASARYNSPAAAVRGGVRDPVVTISPAQSGFP